MHEINSIGRMLVLFGSIVMLVGLAFIFAGKIPWLGKLPGDIYIQKKNFTFFFPLMTSVIISAILSLLFIVLRRK